MKPAVRFIKGGVFEKASTLQLLPLDEVSGGKGKSRLLLRTQLARTSEELSCKSQCGFFTPTTSTLEFAFLGINIAIFYLSSSPSFQPLFIFSLYLCLFL